MRIALAAPLLSLLLALPLLAPLPAEAASNHTAEVSGAALVYAGPGTRYKVIGKLADGTRVHLESCTRGSRWCLFVDGDGDPVGWVRGSYLVGWPAKMEVSPTEFLENPLGFGFHHHPLPR